MAGGDVKDVDKGWLALRARLGAANRLMVTVGVHGPEGQQIATSPEDGGEDGGGGERKRLTVLDVGTFNEYGMGNNPERSFIRATVDMNASANDMALRKIAQAIIQGKYDGRTGLDRFGLLVVGQIQTRISNGIPPPNAPSTIARKGSSTPLIEDGQLRSAVRHQVKEKGPA